MKKYNKSEIMSAAWRIYKNNKARRIEKTFGSCLSLAWRNAKKEIEKAAAAVAAAKVEKPVRRYRIVAEWFIEKNEVEWEFRTFTDADIVAETKKAVKAHDFWIPKSCIAIA